MVRARIGLGLGGGGSSSDDQQQKEEEQQDSSSDSSSSGDVTDTDRTVSSVPRSRRRAAQRMARQGSSDDPGGDVDSGSTDSVTSTTPESRPDEDPGVDADDPSDAPSASGGGTTDVTDTDRTVSDVPRGRQRAMQEMADNGTTTSNTSNSSSSSSSSDVTVPEPDTSDTGSSSNAIYRRDESEVGHQDTTIAGVSIPGTAGIKRFAAQTGQKLNRGNLSNEDIVDLATTDSSANAFRQTVQNAQSKANEGDLFGAGGDLVRGGVDVALDNPFFSVQDTIRGGATAASGADSQQELAGNLQSGWQDIQRGAVENVEDPVANALSGTPLDNSGTDLAADAVTDFGSQLVKEPVQAATAAGTGVDINSGSTEGTANPWGAIDAATLGTSSAVRGAATKAGGAVTSMPFGISAVDDLVQSGSGAADDVASTIDDGFSVANAPSSAQVDETVGLTRTEFESQNFQLPDNIGGLPQNLPASTDDVTQAVDSGVDEVLDESADTGSAEFVENLAQAGGSGGDEVSQVLDEAASVGDDTASTADDAASTTEDAGSSGFTVPGASGIGLGDQISSFRSRMASAFSNVGARTVDDAASTVDESASVADETATQADDAARSTNDDASIWESLGTSAGDDAATLGDDAASGGDDTASVFDSPTSAADETTSAGDDVGTTADDAGTAADDAAAAAGTTADDAGSVVDRFLGSTVGRLGLLGAGAGAALVGGGAVVDQLTNPPQSTTVNGARYEYVKEVGGGSGIIYSVNYEGNLLGYEVIVGYGSDGNLIVVTTDGQKYQTDVSRSEFNNSVSAGGN